MKIKSLSLSVCLSLLLLPLIAWSSNECQVLLIIDSSQSELIKLRGEIQRLRKGAGASADIIVAALEDEYERLLKDLPDGYHLADPPSSTDEQDFTQQTTQKKLKQEASYILSPRIVGEISNEEAKALSTSTSLEDKIKKFDGFVTLHDAPAEIRMRSFLGWHWLSFYNGEKKRFQHGFIFSGTPLKTYPFIFDFPIQRTASHMLSPTLESLQLWNWRTGKFVKNLAVHGEYEMRKHPKRIHYVEDRADGSYLKTKDYFFSADGRYVYLIISIPNSINKSIRVFETSTGELALEASIANTNTFYLGDHTMSSDGEYLVGDGGSETWGVVTPKNGAAPYKVSYSKNQTPGITPIFLPGTHIFFMANANRSEIQFFNAENPDHHPTILKIPEGFYKITWDKSAPRIYVYKDIFPETPVKVVDLSQPD